jgi:predicted NAD/FAD-dependent oxidoreductase
MERYFCTVVGAGISGLLAARRLVSEGRDVLVLEQNEACGGRMATERINGATTDTGAQFFTVRGKRFGGLVEGWMASGVVEEWSRGFPDAGGNRRDSHPRYRCAGGMRALPEHLARGLDIKTGERVVRMNNSGDGWEMVCSSGLRMESEAVVLSAPAPLSAELAQSGNFRIPQEVWERLTQVSYSPCLALLALLDGPPGLPEPGAVQVGDDNLNWICDNRLKGISESSAITVHASPQWSSVYWGEDNKTLSRNLLSLTEEYLGGMEARVVRTSLIRWPHSWVSSLPETHLIASAGPPLLFIGDSFGQPKIEGAILSGLSAADWLLEKSAR